MRNVQYMARNLGITEQVGGPYFRPCLRDHARLGRVHAARVDRRVRNACGRRHPSRPAGVREHSRAERERDSAEPTGRRVLSANVAAQVTGALQGVVTGGTGTAAALGSRPVAGKTGTAENFQDAWFCGYVPQLATCVWVGYPKGEIPLLNVEGVGEVFGGTLPAEIWHNYMAGPSGTCRSRTSRRRTYNGGSYITGSDTYGYSGYVLAVGSTGDIPRGAGHDARRGSISPEPPRRSRRRDDRAARPRPPRPAAAALRQRARRSTRRPTAAGPARRRARRARAAASSRSSTAPRRCRGSRTRSARHARTSTSPAGTSTRPSGSRKTGRRCASSWPRRRSESTCVSLPGRARRSRSSTRTAARCGRRASELAGGTRISMALDSRERPFHCHHEKLVVVDDETAFVGGIDLTALAGDRLDSNDHPPPRRARLARHRRCGSRARSSPTSRGTSALAGMRSAPTGCRSPARRRPSRMESRRSSCGRCPRGCTSPCGDGEWSILESYLRALRAAERLVYLESQFLWSPEVALVLAEKLRRPPCDDFRVIALLPAQPNNGADDSRGQVGVLINADKESATTPPASSPARSTSRGPGGNPVYVHSKAAIVDDAWLTVGSANLNEHSLFNDTECNVVARDPALVREVRLRLWEEHLERPREEIDGDPARVFDELWKPLAEERLERRKRRRLGRREADTAAPRLPPQRGALGAFERPVRRRLASASRTCRAARRIAWRGQAPPIRARRSSPGRARPRSSPARMSSPRSSGGRMPIVSRKRFSSCSSFRGPTSCTVFSGSSRRCIWTIIRFACTITRRCFADSVHFGGAVAARVVVGRCEPPPQPATAVARAAARIAIATAFPLRSARPPRGSAGCAGRARRSRSPRAPGRRS